MTGSDWGKLRAKTRRRAFGCLVAQSGCLLHVVALDTAWWSRLIFALAAVLWASNFKANVVLWIKCHKGRPEYVGAFPAIPWVVTQPQGKTWLLRIEVDDGDDH